MYKRQGTTDLALCRYTVGNPPKNEILSIYPTADSPIFFGGSRVDELLCRFQMCIRDRSYTNLFVVQPKPLYRLDPW